MADPTRKEVESIQRRIDTVNRQLKPLSKNCVKKVKGQTHPQRSIVFSLQVYIALWIWRSWTETNEKQEKEYKEILEMYNEKSKEKALLVNRLIEVNWTPSPHLS